MTTSLIQHELPKAANVSLRVYDMLGQEVAVLVNERKEPGYYHAAWNASNVPSGIHFYRLQAVGFVDTKKAILLK